MIGPGSDKNTNIQYKVKNWRRESSSCTVYSKLVQLKGKYTAIYIQNVSMWNWMYTAMNIQNIYGVGWKVKKCWKSHTCVLSKCIQIISDVFFCWPTNLMIQIIQGVDKRYRRVDRHRNGVDICSFHYDKICSLFPTANTCGYYNSNIQQQKQKTAKSKCNNFGKSK